MVLNFFQLRNYTGFSFQLSNSENAGDNYTVPPWQTTARGDMWLAQGDGRKGVTILASCDGAPVRPLLHMRDHDWAIRYRIGGQTNTHTISVNGNKDFSIDVRDTHFTFHCYNGSFSGGQSSVDVSEWKDQLTFSFSEVISSDTGIRKKRETDDIRDPTTRERQNVMDLIAEWEYDFLEHGRRQGTLVENVDRLRGWRIDLQDNGAVVRRNMHFYNIAVQYGSGNNNVFAHVLVPVGYVIGRRRIRNALLESMRNREVAIVIPPDNQPTSGDALHNPLLDRVAYTSDEARNSWAVRSLAWLCVLGSRVLR